jgi:hypothetical protein
MMTMTMTMKMREGRSKAQFLSVLFLPEPYHLTFPDYFEYITLGRIPVFSRGWLHRLIVARVFFVQHSSVPSTNAPV